MTRVIIVDYGMGNLKSVQRGLEKVGATTIITGNSDQIENGDCLVLPGVGAFENGMAGLRKAGLIEPINEFVRTGKPFLGICLGMQMLMEVSEERGLHKGLGFIPGSVVEIPSAQDGKVIRKIPHIGWNELILPTYGRATWKETLLEEIKQKESFYFVHSFMAVPQKDEHLLARCEYEGMKITAAIKKDNVTGLQFHPEKSGEKGLQILEKFING